MDNLAGWIASAFTLATFACCQGRALRLCALAANAAFIVYGATAHLWPVLALHAILVPLNLWRLSQLRSDAPSGRVAPNGSMTGPALVRIAAMRRPMIRARRNLRFYRLQATATARSPS
ncbi:MAG: hypothetical protein ABI641_02085 [Caldimonas sp.]